ncbi:MAG: hypothetical protein AAFU70_07335, partial [Planctomycetota bacterium]
KICNVAPRTVSKWFDSGQLKGYRIPGSKDRRIPLGELMRFMKAHGIPMDGITGGRTRVLIVDHEPDVVQVLSDVLGEQTDFEVRSATSAFQAGLECERIRCDPGNRPGPILGSHVDTRRTAAVPLPIGRRGVSHSGQPLHPPPGKGGAERPRAPVATGRASDVVRKDRSGHEGTGDDNRDPVREERTSAITRRCRRCDARAPRPSRLPP